MKQFTSLTDPELVSCLQNGGVAVIPTDTIYGIVALASNQRAVERVYRLRIRASEKPCIILAANKQQLQDVSLWSPLHHQLADTYWPGAMSLVTPVTAASPEYLHRGTHTLAYRVPNYPELQQLLAVTGPLIAPSANHEGERTAVTMAEAQAYFDGHVDGYVDGGSLANHRPSTVVRIDNGKVNILRPGAAVIEQPI